MFRLRRFVLKSVLVLSGMALLAGQSCPDISILLPGSGQPVPVIIEPATVSIDPFMDMTSYNVQLGDPVQIGAVVTGGQPPYLVTFDFGDNTDMVTVPVAAPDSMALQLHTYALVGTYNVVITAQDANGDIDVLNDTVNVYVFISN